MRSRSRRQERRLQGWAHQRAELAKRIAKLESHRKEYGQIPTHGSLIAERHIAKQIARIDAELPTLRKRARALQRKLAAGKR